MHTPGPWTQQKAGPWLLGADGKEVVSLAFATRDDARLIAAAPAMLAELQGIVAAIDEAVNAKVRAGRLPNIGALLSRIQDGAQSAINEAIGR